MKKTKIITFIITTIALTIAFGVSTYAFFKVKPYDKGNGEIISEELKEARSKFKLELDKKANEYYILGIKEEAEKSKKIIIPESIDGILVTKILDEENSFSSFRHISEIVISKNIKYIGSNRKDYMTYRDAFQNATGISTFTVSEENAYFASVDGVLYTKDLKTLIKFPSSKSFATGHVAYEIPEGVIEIAPKAFYLNNIIEQIIFNDDLQTVGRNAFYNCTKLDDIIFNDVIQTIEDNAFEGCILLKAVTLPKSLKAIGRNAFKSCTNLREIEILSLEVELEDTDAFSSITSVTDTWTIKFIIPKENEELINKFNSLSFIRSIGINGLSIEYERYITLNGKYAVINGNDITYQENQPR